MLGLKRKENKYHRSSPFWPSVDGSCFFSTWFLLPVSCAASPRPCVALCRCPGHSLSSGPLTRTSEHFTAFMAHTSLPGRWHLFSGHLDSPFKENETQWKSPLCTSQWEHLTQTTTSVSCNSLRANINWVWTSMKDTANSHLDVCIWKILRGAGSWSEAMLVFAEYNTSSRFCIVSFQMSTSAQADGRARVCLFTEL